MQPLKKIELTFYATAEHSPLIAGAYLVLYNGDGVVDILEYRGIAGEWAWRDHEGNVRPTPFAWAWLHTQALIDILLA